MEHILIEVLNNPVFIVLVRMQLVDILLEGAVMGLLSGALAGAMIYPSMRTPDVMGRAFAIGIFLAIGVAVFEFFRIGDVTGGSVQSIMDTFMGSASAMVGQMIGQAVWHVFIGLLVGFVIGLATAVPGEVIKGAAGGLFLGALVGAGLRFAVVNFNMALNDIFFQIVVGLIVWALFLSVLGGAAQEDRAKMKAKKEKERKDWE